MKLPALSHRTVVTGAVVAAVAAGGAGAALATTGGSGDTYAGCLNKGTGILYRVAVNPQSAARCHSGDRAVAWNQQGVQGDPGPAGTPGTNGTDGAPGQRGPSDGYASALGTYTLTDAAATEVQHLTLPEGQYLVNGLAQVTNAGSDGPEVAVCELAAPGGDPLNVSLATLADGATTTVPAMAHATVPAGGGTVTLTCRLTVGVRVSYNRARLTAVAVGTLHTP